MYWMLEFDFCLGQFHFSMGKYLAETAQKRDLVSREVRKLSVWLE